MEESEGYKSCHSIDSLDATKCAEDCKEFEKQEFAKNCTENGGLFKCCIRRDKMFCHECRFCCTLPMCTFSPGTNANTDFDMERKIALKDQETKIRADSLFFSDEHIYKKPDYHCLKPDSHEDPKKWHKYEAEGFRRAFNKEMLNRTKTFEYDKYLNNFEDPEVFAAFTKSEKSANKLWKKSYNQLYTKMMPGIKSTSYNLSSDGTWWNRTDCIKKCIKMENSKFAKKCEADGGYFKCCVRGWYLSPYEDARNQLIDDGLINDKKSHICDHTASKDRCLFCSTNGMCTKRNYVDRKISNVFYPGKKKRCKCKYMCSISN